MILLFIQEYYVKRYNFIMPVYGGDLVVPDKSLHEFLWERLLKYGDTTALVRMKLFKNQIPIGLTRNIHRCFITFFISTIQIDCSRNGKSLTFKQMHDRSKKCAAYLQSQGIKKGDFVAISSPNCVEWSFLMIGIIGSGATVAPCNPSYRKGEVKAKSQT